MQAAGANGLVVANGNHVVNAGASFALSDACERSCVSRFGDLHCSSEVLSLRWQDVDRDAGRITITSPKTEHHLGKATRTIPLFRELRSILAEAFELAVDGADYVVSGSYRQAADAKRSWRNCNLRTQFERSMKRAGLTPWLRLFPPLRVNPETQLAGNYPIHVVTAWLGNTARIALKHFLQATDADFEQTSGGGAESGTGAVQKRRAATRRARRRRSAKNDASPCCCKGLCENSRVAAKACEYVERRGQDFPEWFSQLNVLQVVTSASCDVLIGCAVLCAVTLCHGFSPVVISFVPLGQTPMFV